MIEEVFILKIGWVGKLLLDFMEPFYAKDIIAFVSFFSLSSHLVSMYVSNLFPRIRSSLLAIRLISQSRGFLPQYIHRPITMPLYTYHRLVLSYPHHPHPVPFILPMSNRIFIYHMSHAVFFFSFPFLTHTLSPPIFYTK